MDEDLIKRFSEGVDIYIYTAKLYLGEDGWNNLSEVDKKMWRKRFKTIFLGVLYGLGKNSLAVRLNSSVEEAENIIQGLYKAFPKLREYVASQQLYPLQHNGYINTFFGDKLKIEEWKYYLKAKNERERKNQEARIQRLGVNLPIQGGTSTAMSSGFFNDLRVAKQNSWDLTSFITVHDSNTCNFRADKVWEIRKFYDHNFTDFCYDMTGIKLLFDLEVGSNYNDSASMKQIADDIVEFSGTAHSILQIMDRMDECEGLIYETDIPRSEIIPKYIENPIQRFIDEKGCSMIKDKSKYKVQFKKLS
jgi:DNA polymerase I-like protein with 3'-5' exonuclease and polymerase domains